MDLRRGEPAQSKGAIGREACIRKGPAGRAPESCDLITVKIYRLGGRWNGGGSGARVSGCD